MKETELNKVLNYMKQYVENKYEHDSEPMLNYKDIQLVLNEIERLNNIINELEIWLEEVDIFQRDIENISSDHITVYNVILDKLKALEENK